MSSVNHIVCGLPCFGSNLEPQTKLSLIFRVSSTVLGLILVLSGVFILARLPYMSYFGTRVGIAALLSGVVIVGAASLVKCVQHSTSATLTSDSPKEQKSTQTQAQKHRLTGIETPQKVGPNSADFFPELALEIQLAILQQMDPETRINFSGTSKENFSLVRQCPNLEARVALKAKAIEAAFTTWEQSSNSNLDIITTLLKAGFNERILIALKKLYNELENINDTRSRCEFIYKMSKLTQCLQTLSCYYYSDEIKDLSLKTLNLVLKDSLCNHYVNDCIKSVATFDPDKALTYISKVHQEDREKIHYFILTKSVIKLASCDHEVAFTFIDNLKSEKEKVGALITLINYCVALKKPHLLEMIERVSKMANSFSQEFDLQFIKIIGKAYAQIHHFDKTINLIDSLSDTAIFSKLSLFHDIVDNFQPSLDIAQILEKVSSLAKKMDFIGHYEPTLLVSLVNKFIKLGNTEAKEIFKTLVPICKQHNDNFHLWWIVDCIAKIDLEYAIEISQSINDSNLKIDALISIAKASNAFEALSFFKQALVLSDQIPEEIDRIQYKCRILENYAAISPKRAKKLLDEITQNLHPRFSNNQELTRLTLPHLARAYAAVEGNKVIDSVKNLSKDDANTQARAYISIYESY